MNKKVLLVVPLSTLEWGTKNAGGVDSVCQVLVRYLAERGESDFHYRVLAFDPFSAESYSGEAIHLSPAVEIVKCPVNEKRMGFPLPGFISAPLRVREQVKQYKPDVIHSHISSWLLGVPKRLKRVSTFHAYRTIGRKPVSWSNDFLYARLIPKVSHYFIDYYTCVGKILKNVLEADHNQLVTVIGNPIDDIYFIDRQLKLKSDRLILISCALISRQKQIEKAIKLAAELKSSGISVQLKIIGPNVDDTYFQELQKMVADFLLLDDVEFMGKLGSKEITDAYSKADIGVFFSKQETFGLAPLEMLAAGLPLLTTSVGILDEHRHEFEKRGVLYVESVQNQVQAILQLQNTENTEARDYVRSKFRVSHVADSYEDIYKDLVGVS